MNKEEKSVIYEDLVESIKNIYLQGTKRKKKTKQKKTNIQLFQSIMIISKRSLKFLKATSQYHFQYFKLFSIIITLLRRKLGSIGPAQQKINPLRANPTKQSNTLTQFVGKLPTNCLSVFDHFMGLACKGLSCLRLMAKPTELLSQHFEYEKINVCEYLLKGNINFCNRIYTLFCF